MSDMNFNNLSDAELEQKRKESWKKIEAELKRREEEEAKRPAIIRWIRKVYLRIETKIELLHVEYKMRTDREFREMVKALEAEAQNKECS